METRFCVSKNYSQTELFYLLFGQKICILVNRHNVAIKYHHGRDFTCGRVFPHPWSSVSNMKPTQLNLILPTTVVGTFPLLNAKLQAIEVIFFIYVKFMLIYMMIISSIQHYNQSVHKIHLIATYDT